MNLYTADYVLVAATLAATIFGLFGGFSSALGFCAGVAAAGLTVKFGLPPARSFLSTRWALILVGLTAALLAFGIARLIVKRIVKGLLAQPADAIFGAIVSAVTGVAVTLAAFFAAHTYTEMQFESTIYTYFRGLL